jgi:cold shock CspA family protein
MSIPLQLTFRNTDRSKWIEEAVEAELIKLEKFSDQIQQCRVVIEKSNNHHHKANIFHVRVSMIVEGKEIIVSKESASESAGKDVHTALKHAFDVIPKKLEKLDRLDDPVHLRHCKKREYYTIIEHAQVARVFTEDGFGFLQTTDGNEVYFEKDSLVGGLFDQLLPGTDVAFAAEAGRDGPVVSWVSAVRS